MTLPIVTERLILRRFTHTDVPDVLQFASHPSVVKVTAETMQATEDGIKEYIDLQNSYQPFEKDKVFDLAVERTEDNRAIGLLTLVCREPALGEIGWALGVEYRGCGYATEAATGLMNYGFQVLGLHRIQADTNSHNPASWKVMERLGMRREGILRDAVHEDGKWIDKYVYGILSHEWHNRTSFQ